MVSQRCVNACGRRYLRVAEPLCMLSEREVRRNDIRRALVEFANQAEQQNPSARSERQVAELV